MIACIPTEVVEPGMRLALTAHTRLGLKILPSLPDDFAKNILIMQIITRIL